MRYEIIMRKLKVYVAGPYSKPDPCTNTNYALKIAQDLACKDFIPFVPHLYHFWKIVIPNSEEFFLELDMRWLESCDALLRIPGESFGADREIERARQLEIPVLFSVSSVIDWRAGLEAK